MVQVCQNEHASVPRMPGLVRKFTRCGPLHRRHTACWLIVLGGLMNKLIFAALTTASLTAACTAHVESGGNGGGGGGGGGSQECEAYNGPCKPGETYTCGTPPAVGTGVCEVGPDC